MKFWECINVPGKTNVKRDEGVVDSTPSSANVTFLSDKSMDPEKVAEVQEALKTAETADAVVEPISDGSSMILSQEYINIATQAFGKAIVLNGANKTTETVDEGDVPEETSETVEEFAEYTPEEADAKQYVSADEVDASAYETNSEFEAEDVDTTDDAFDLSETTEPSNYITAEDLATAEPGTVEQLVELAADVSHTSLNKDVLLDGIFGTSSTSSDVDEVIGEASDKESKPQSTETEYCRTDAEIEEIVATFNKYEEKYFKEIPAEHFSRRFLGNIPDHVYKAHDDAIVRDEPDIMDPLFLLYITLTDDPYFAIGKFIDIITTEAVDNNEWSKAISRSVEEYEKYIAPDEEDGDEEESSN